MAVGGQDDPLRAHAHVREKGSRAGAAVVDEGNRTSSGIDSVLCIRHVEHRGFRRTVVGFDDVRGRSGCVRDLLAADAGGVMCNRGFLFGWQFLFFRRILLFVAGSGAWRGLLRSSTTGPRTKELRWLLGLGDSLLGGGGLLR
jgi:hypothetical protein